MKNCADEVSSALKTLNSLTDRLPSLRTFEQVEIWDREAKKQIEILLAAFPEMDEHHVECNTALHKYVSEKTFISKLKSFDSKKIELSKEIPKTHSLSNYNTKV